MVGVNTTPEARPTPPFARLGAFVARYRWPVLIGYLISAVVFGIFGVQVFANLKTEGFSDPGGEAARAAAYVQDEFGVIDPAVVLIIQTPTDVDADAPAANALLDDVAADFPLLTIVMAHPAVPWVDSQIAIAAHKANCYIDLSGWSPKYFPPQLIKAIGRQLRTKVLFGTDHPYITVERWRRDFETLEVDPDALPLILKGNAMRVLGIGQPAPPV